MMKNMRNDNIRNETFSNLKNTINQNVENNYDYTTKIYQNDQANVENATNEI